MMTTSMNRHAPALLTTLIVAGGLLTTAPGAFAQAAPTDTAAISRQAVQSVGAAIVTVNLVLKITDEDGPDESPTGTIGVIIDPSGLTVVSLSSIDPSVLVGQMMGGDAPFQATVTDLKILLNDGQEIPAKIVLRDKDQDLAFLRPAKKVESPLPAVDLSNSATREMLDPVLLVSRLGKVANRTLSARTIEVEGVLERPRRRYMLPNGSAATDVGSLALTPEGKIVGLVGLKISRVTGGEVTVLSMVMGGGAPALIASNIIPAGDIAAVAAQAPQDAPKETITPAKPAPKAPVKK